MLPNPHDRIMPRLVGCILLSFLLVALCATELAHALAEGSSRVELFKRQSSTVPFEDNDGHVRQRVVHSFRLPSLVNVEGVMVAIADARYTTSNDNSFIETVVKYSVDDGETWETQIAIKNSRVSSISRVVDPTVIVKGNKIYVLVGSFNKTGNYWTQHKDGKDWEPLLAVGEVTKTDDGGKTTANISWGRPVSLKCMFPAELEGAQTKAYLGGAGVATVASNGDLVFPVQITDMQKRVFAMIMYSEDDGKTWEFAKGRSDFVCSEPVVLEWEGKLIINTRVDKGRRLVYETGDMGKPWTESVTLSRVWGSSPNSDQPGSQASFIAVTIEGKRVMLFTHPLNFKGNWLRDRLHLWVTDNQRIFDVGQVSIGDENSAYSSVLYKDDKLYCLHEINSNEVYSLAFARLVGELEIIKSVLRSWKAQDERFSNICTPVPPSTPPSDDNCGATIPTVGLVGFLSHRAHKRAGWEDVYHCVNAEISNAERVPYGLRFKGKNAGALWPVGLQGQNRRYQFANSRFTLVATVTIDEVPRGASPLLGARLSGSHGGTLLGLSYDENRRWQPIHGSTPVSPTRSWELKKKYHVVLTMADKRGYVYVDGEPLPGPSEAALRGEKLPDISHFYLGGYKSEDKSTDSRVTVSNVLLYNRKLNSSEIKTLFLSQDFIGTKGSRDDDTDDNSWDADDRAPSPLFAGGKCFAYVYAVFVLVLAVLG